MSNQIVPGSIQAISMSEKKSIAETFIDATTVVIVDTSGSMDSKDSRGGQSRYKVACEELATLQRNLPGKIAVLAFSDETKFCPSGVPYYFGGNTDLAGALTFAKVADVPGMRFIVISDGQPDSETDALRIASTYKNKIDVIYVGPERDPYGRAFLERLAKASGGSFVTDDRAKELSSTIVKLLGKG